jgi:hypothetical protein
VISGEFQILIMVVLKVRIRGPVKLQFPDFPDQFAGPLRKVRETKKNGEQVSYEKGPGGDPAMLEVRRTLTVFVVLFLALLLNLDSTPPTVAFHSLKSALLKDFHHHLHCQPPEWSSHVLSDCSLALYPPESTLFSLINRHLLCS